MDVASVFRAFAALAWLILVGTVILAILQASRGRGVRWATPIIIGSLVAAVLLTTISSGIVFIRPQERGVVLSALSPKGYREQALQPGLRWIMPYVESVVVYPISKQTYTMSKTTTEGQIQGDDSISARTLDGQEIFIDSSVIFQIDPDKVVQVHIAWQNRYENDLVRAQARGAIRDAVSQFRVEEVVSTKRFDLVQQISQVLAKKLSDNGLVLVDFVLRNITFSPEYAASVEQKQIAEQQAQQAKFVVEQRKQEAEQARQVAQGSADAAVIRAKGDADARVIQAQAEAQALNLIANVLKENPALIQYTYVNKLSPNVQVMLVPANAPYLLPLPTMTSTGADSSGPASSVVPTPLPTTAAPTPAPTPTAKP